MITRYQTVVYLLYPVVLALSVAPKGGRNGSRAAASNESAVALERWSAWRQRVAAACASFALVALVQLVAWKGLYGRWLPDAYVGESFLFREPQLRAVLFSPFHGLFYWSPLLLLGAIAFFGWMWWGSSARWRRAEACWVVSLLATYYLNAAWECWWFGASFGSRAFEGCVLFFMVGTAFGFEVLRRSRWRFAMLGVVTILILANLALLNAWRRNWIPADAPVTFAEMLRGAWRYPFSSSK